MKDGPVTVIGRNLIERFSSKIEFSKAQRRENEIKLTVRILWPKARDLFAPRNRLFAVLLLRCFRQYVENRQRIGMLRQEFACGLSCFAGSSLLQHGSSFM